MGEDRGFTHSGGSRWRPCHGGGEGHGARDTGDIQGVQTFCQADAIVFISHGPCRGGRSRDIDVRARRGSQKLYTIAYRDFCIRRITCIEILQVIGNVRSYVGIDSQDNITLG